MARRNRNRAEEAKQSKGRVGLTKKQLLAKAAAMTGNFVSEASALSSIDERELGFSDQGAVAPEYDPETLLRFIELSPHLLPSIAAYAQNIEGYGHARVVCEPWMDDLESEEAFESVKQAMIIESWIDSEEQALTEAQKIESARVSLVLAKERRAALLNSKDGEEIAKADLEVDEAQQAYDEASGDGVNGLDEDGITDDEVKAKLDEIGVQLRREAYLFDAFFKKCCSAMPFGRLRRIVRFDIEAHGWGCIEMERDTYGRLKRLSYVPAYTVRPLENRGELVDVIEDDSITPLSENREIVVKRRFDIFVQIVGGRKVYYRSPGDPRIISRTTGKAYKSEDEMRKSTEDGGEGKNAQAANDLLWIAQHSPMTPCPPPRWIGNLLQVLGGREADETNWYYLHDSAIPYGLLFVSGGTIPTDIRSRLENRLATEVRGSEGSGKILVVQAKPMGKTSADGKQVLPEMTFQSLRDAVDNDALFLKYDERGADRIGASFRLPPILRGYTPQTLNRATAFAAIYLAEQQVFQPEREDGDWLYNKYILPEIGVKLYRFVSNSPPTRDVEDVANIIKAAAPHGGLLPQEIRAMLSDLLNRPFAKIQEDWAQQPMVMTLAGLGDAGIGNGSLGDEENMGIVNQRLAQAEQRIAQIVQEELATLGTNVDVRAAFMDRAGNGENE